MLVGRFAAICGCLMIFALTLASTPIYASSVLSGYTSLSSHLLIPETQSFLFNVTYYISGFTITPNGHIHDPNPASSELSATWDWGDGTLSSGWPSGLNHVYKKVGNYTIRMTVVDDLGNVNTQISPIFIPGKSSNPFSAKINLTKNGLTITPNGSVHDSASNAVFISALWNWGDGTVSTGWPMTLNHTYPSTGNYSLSVSFTDNLGNEGVYQKYVFFKKNFNPQQQFVPQITTLRIGQNLTSGYISVKLENLAYLDKNGSARAQLVVYNNGVYTNQVTVKPLTTVKVDSGGTMIYIYVGQTLFGLHDNKTAEVEVEYVQ